jgi:hypothetical protein
MMFKLYLGAGGSENMRRATKEHILKLVKVVNSSIESPLNSIGLLISGSRLPRACLGASALSGVRLR